MSKIAPGLHIRRSHWILGHECHLRIYFVDKNTGLSGQSMRRPEGGLIGLVGVEVTQGHTAQTLSGSTSVRREIREPVRKKTNEAKRPW